MKITWQAKSRARRKTILGEEARLAGTPFLRIYNSHQRLPHCEICNVSLSLSLYLRKYKSVFTPLYLAQLKSVSSLIACVAINLGVIGNLLAVLQVTERYSPNPNYTLTF